ncbi:MAG TPA: hypothetical protein VNE39_03795 [Planctomycetota bacterium]|nr:hypothetical protein [Planctomycetota bacterium]
MAKSAALLLALVCACAAGLAEDDGMVPFTMDWRDNGRALVDLSSLLEKPAGKDGFVQVKDGHLCLPSGRRLRIWGVNFTGGACFPTEADAPAVADHLARFGVNCVRFHFLDSNWGKGASVFPPGADTTRRLDAAQLDRLDRFVWELKRRGIYTNLNLNVGRVYREADGVADRESIGLGKALQYFDERIAELHREYAEQLLTHRNPYTKTEYRHEPAVALVELVNENSVVEAWFCGRLRGKQTAKNPGTWSDITPHYAELLTRKFNDWLAERYPAAKLQGWRDEAKVGAEAPIPRLEPEQFAKASAERFAAEAAFYMELEDRYFQRMDRLLKGLGVKALVVASSDHSHWRTGYPLVASAAKLDVVDGHVYWQHPRYVVDPKTQKRGFWIPNSPMVNEPLESSVVQLARTAVAGKPYTVSEVNHPFPSEYAAEGIPILAAYALLQDWDGIFLYTFEHAGPAEWASRRPGHFDIRPDPVKMSQIAACAAMFHRADVAAARETVARSYSAAQVVESLRLPTSEKPLYTPGFSRAIPLVHATRIRSFQQQGGGYPKLDASDPIVSDTGELTWHHGGKQGLVTVATGRTQALIGFVGGTARTAGGLTAEVSNPFCSILLTSLDDKPLEDSGRMLLVAGARVANTGMRWAEGRHTLADWGRAPMRIEPVKGRVLLRRRDGAAALEVVALDGASAPLGPAEAARPGDKGVELRLDKPTVWYLIRAVAGE